MSILYVDTATSDKWRYPIKGEPQPDEQQPHMVRLAWLLTEDDGRTVRETCHLIRLPLGERMASEAAFYAGVFDHQLDERGMKMFGVLTEYAEALGEVRPVEVENGGGLIVAHNWHHHRQVLERSLRYVGMPARTWPESLCAMIKATKIVGIEKKQPGGGFKWPTFDECHERMMGQRYMPSSDPIADGIARVRAVRTFKSYIDRG